jgi:hypothetical protein
MKNRDTLGGLLLIAIGLFFGIQSLSYPLGTLAQIGPGLFPLAVSCIVVVLGTINVIRSRFTDPVAPSFNLRGILCIFGAIVAFVLLSTYVNMIVGIIALVIIASLGAETFSPPKVAGLAGSLIVIAFVFQRFFQLDLPLY